MYLCRGIMLYSHQMFPLVSCHTAILKDSDGDPMAQPFTSCDHREAKGAAHANGLQCRRESWMARRGSETFGLHGLWACAGPRRTRDGSKGKAREGQLPFQEIKLGNWMSYKGGGKLYRRGVLVRSKGLRSRNPKGTPYCHRTCEKLEGVL